MAIKTAGYKPFGDLIGFYTITTARSSSTSQVSRSPHQGLPLHKDIPDLQPQGQHKRRQRHGRLRLQQARLDLAGTPLQLQRGVRIYLTRLYRPMLCMTRGTPASLGSDS